MNVNSSRFTQRQVGFITRDSLELLDATYRVIMKSFYSHILAKKEVMNISYFYERVREEIIDTESVQEKLRQVGTFADIVTRVLTEDESRGERARKGIYLFAMQEQEATNVNLAQVSRFEIRRKV